jgi:hypothetical protein
LVDGSFLNYGRDRRKNHLPVGFQTHIADMPKRALPHIYDNIFLPRDSLRCIWSISCHQLLEEFELQFMRPYVILDTEASMGAQKPLRGLIGVPS